jgi:hypothetical protein
MGAGEALKVVESGHGIHSVEYGPGFRGRT